MGVIAFVFGTSIIAYTPYATPLSFSCNATDDRDSGSVPSSSVGTNPIALVLAFSTSNMCSDPSLSVIQRYLSFEDIATPFPLRRPEPERVPELGRRRLQTTEGRNSPACTTTNTGSNVKKRRRSLAAKGMIATWTGCRGSGCCFASSFTLRHIVSHATWKERSYFHRIKYQGGGSSPRSTGQGIHMP